MSYSADKVWATIKTVRLELKKKLGAENSVNFLLDEEDTVEKMINLKPGDKVLLKGEPLKIGTNSHILLTKPIEVILPFKIKNHETVADFLKNDYFLSGFDCHMETPLPIVFGNDNE
jgi:hypothetical protein